MSGRREDLDPLGAGDDTAVGGEADGFDAEAKKAELKRKRLGQRAILVAAGGLVAVVLLVVLVRAAFSGGEKPVAVASVAEGAKVYQAPGAPDLPPATMQAYEDKNTQLYQDAERKGQTSVGYPVFKPGDPPPPPPPLQVPQPVAQPVAQQPIQAVPTINEADLRKAIEKAINETKLKATTDRKPTMVAGLETQGSPANGGYSPVGQPVGPTGTPAGLTMPGASGGAQFNGHADAMNDGAMSTSLRGGGAEIAGPHEAYGVTQVAADSDAPAEVVVEILGGPLVGATVYGTASFRQKSASVTITRMYWRGQEYTVKGLLLDADTRSPALPVDVDNYYFERIIWPAFAGGLGIAGKVASQPASTVQNIGGGLGGTIVTQTQPSTGRQIAGGFAEGGAGTAAQILKQDAGELKPTVRVAARQAVVVVFTSSVRTGDVRK